MKKRRNVKKVLKNNYIEIQQSSEVKQVNSPPKN